MTDSVAVAERAERRDPGHPRWFGAISPLANIGIPVVVLAFFMVWSAHGQVRLVHVALVGLAIAGTQLLPGVLLWRVIRPREGWLIEDLAFGFVAGSVLAIIAQIPAGLLGLHWLSWVLCLAVAVAVVAVPVGRRRVLSARTSPLPWWWGGAVVVWSLTAIPLLRQYFAQNPVRWSGGGFHAPHTDTNLHLALAAQLLERGPTRFPWVQSEQLGYHYFSHAWIAQVSATSGVGLDEVMLRIMPGLFVVILPLVAGAAAVRLTRAAWAGPIAAFIFVVAGRPDPIAGGGTGFNWQTPFSPTVAPSAGMLIVLVVLIALRWRGELGRWASLPVVFVLSIAAAGAKGATTPLVVAGAGLALVAMIVFDRSKLRLVLLDLVAVGLGLEFAVRVIFRNSEEGLHLSLNDSAQQTALGPRLGDSVLSNLTASTASVVITLAAGALGLAFVCFKDLRRRPELWMLAGGMIAGAGAAGVFAHPGKSQGYFPIAAKPLMALASVIVLVELVRRLPTPIARRLVASAAVGGVSLAWLVPALGYTNAGPGVLYAGLVGGLAVVVASGVIAAMLVGRQRVVFGVTAALSGMVVASLLSGGHAVMAVAQPEVASVKPTVPFAQSMQMIRAARFIRDHSGRNDLVMTNTHCAEVTDDPSDGCDSREFLVAAYSQRQVLVEGWTATPRSAAEGPHGRDSITVPYWHPGLLALNDGFIKAPTASAAADLWKRGVRWIFADHRRPWSTDLGQFADLRLHNRDVSVYQLRQPE